MNRNLSLFCLLLGVSCAMAFEEHGAGRALGLFEVIKFPNTYCDADDSSRNGTCYTAEECTDKGGTASGTCASGYGVCCVITLGCGGYSSENITYIEQKAFTAASALDANPCFYKVCKLTTDICRIRLDFTIHKLAAPVEGLAVVGGATTVADTNSMGACTTDTFTYSGAAGSKAPLICGYNTGQHMILDAADSCNTLSFSIGSTSVSRQWTIKVTQYNCGEEMAGPSGCLQYFTADSGNFATFNYDTSASSSALTQTHLQSQDYSYCIRRKSGNCRICYTPHYDDPTANADTAPQASYGLSLSPAAASQSGQDTDCTTDYISINEAVANTVTVSTTAGTNRQCGRFFSSARAATDSATVCSLQIPFRLGVHFDNTEALTATTATMAQLNEQSEVPSGIQGFWLDYFQTAC